MPSPPRSSVRGRRRPGEGAMTDELHTDRGHRWGRDVIAALALGSGLALVGLLAGAEPAGATTATVVGTQLRVNGTGGADTIVVRALNPSTIQVSSAGLVA